MIIWVDADSCPQAVRDIIARAAVKRGLKAVYAANVKIPIPEDELIEMVVVKKGEGVADQYIIDHAEKGDLAITRDIPLAAELVDKHIVVINDRGNHFTPDNIRERLSIRDLMKDFREMGIMPERESTFGRREIQQFAAAFDRELTKLLK
ncbi:MAG: YaiI/YqxD family protein [Spirochaetales bacterium]|uniref:UPF0178 protein PQJ61_11770 n=1 Tax=Candidatus Thalassospirochaeta sargassi TaxID=3119039 RepID=A0AAJ1ML31_9SPIO|nr:YaiI/YqxD family protein [Spirochaetales bacterium]